MSAIEIVNKQMVKLPPEIQIQVVDYITYLSSKYGVEEDELLLEQFLLQRAEEGKKEQRVSWKTIKTETYQKYNKNV